MRPAQPAPDDRFDDGEIDVLWRIGAERAQRTLVWTIDLRARRAEALVCEAGREPERAAGPVRIRTAVEGNALHIDAEMDGQERGDPLLAATIRIDGPEPRLLFARTSLFRALRIEGGRYEPVGMERRRAAQTGATTVRIDDRRPARRPGGAWAHSAAR